MTNLPKSREVRQPCSCFDLTQACQKSSLNRHSRHIQLVVIFIRLIFFLSVIFGLVLAFWGRCQPAISAQIKSDSGNEPEIAQLRQRLLEQLDDQDSERGEYSVMNHVIVYGFLIDWISTRQLSCLTTLHSLVILKWTKIFNGKFLTSSIIFLFQIF